MSGISLAKLVEVTSLSRSDESSSDSDGSCDSDNGDNSGDENDDNSDGDCDDRAEEPIVLPKAQRAKRGEGKRKLQTNPYRLYYSAKSTQNTKGHNNW